MNINSNPEVMKFFLALVLAIFVFGVRSFRFGSPIISSRTSQKNTVAKQFMTNNLNGRDIDGEFTPLNNMVLVKKVDIIDKTEGGIFLTGKQKIEKSQGSVVSVGIGRTNQDTGVFTPMPVSVGDGVVYGKYYGEDVEYNGARHSILRDDDILFKYQIGEPITCENVEMIRDNILVKLDEKEEESVSGVLIAKTSRGKKMSTTGLVVKVGPGRMASNGTLMKVDIASGDMVKIRGLGAGEVEIGGENYAVVKMTDVLCKF